ncbi:serine hydrolase domain-containing protein [Pedobacter faecalis]|uniref:serine hydrolase domain-containing protein n=1 Tax=Pedobacter faecalis TaxID=3041495 RepID=UPI00254FC6A0|nr:serine hydrolase domain-containing protein [Pedobacter sp. ELA7]
MKNILLILLLLCQVRLSTQAQDWQDTAKRIDQIFDIYKKDRPGCQIAISRNGQLLYSKAFGMADLENQKAMSPQTLIEAGSVSKQFTAASILLLEQQGKLSLDEDVHKYLPELPLYPSKLTLRQMMQHTSGLKDCWALLSPSDAPRGSKIYRNQDILDLLSRQSLNHSPGAEFMYSNTNYVLLAIIAERVSGETLQKFTRRFIFKPAGLSHTRWRTNANEIIGNRSIAYAPDQSSFLPDMPNEEVYGSGGLLTTAEDLLKWNKYYTGDRLGKPGLLQKQISRSPLNDGQTNDYAAGLRIVQIRNWKVYIHDGATAAYRSSLEYYPETGLSIAWLANTSAFDGKPDGLNELRQLLLPEKTSEVKLEARQEPPQKPLKMPEVVAVPNAIDPIPLESVTGHYYSDEVQAELDIKLNNGQLEIHRKSNEVFKLATSSDGNFRIQDSKVTLQILRDDLGNISAISFTTPRVRNIVFRKVLKTN